MSNSLLRLTRARWIRRAGFVAACLLAYPAFAQDYPTRPVTIVVGFPAGSATDNLVRPLAAALQKSLGQPVVVENKAGAQGIIATEYAARAKPDGYTLLAGSSTTLAANVGLFKKLPYDPAKDFQPVAGVGATSMMFMVRADSQSTALADPSSSCRRSGCDRAATDVLGDDAHAAHACPDAGTAHRRDPRGGGRRTGACR
jgi:tripartite-type tricarboxylate transporter receptor subunit TctC